MGMTLLHFANTFAYAINKTTTVIVLLRLNARRRRETATNRIRREISRQVDGIDYLKSDGQRPQVARIAPYCVTGFPSKSKRRTLNIE